MMRGVVGCMNEVRVRANYSIGIREGLSCTLSLLYCCQECNSCEGNFA